MTNIPFWNRIAQADDRHLALEAIEAEAKLLLLVPHQDWEQVRENTRRLFILGMRWEAEGGQIDDTDTGTP